MKVNYTLDKNNVIIEYHSIPFDPKKPFIIIDDNKKINVGFDKIINNKLIKQTKKYNTYNKELKEKLNKQLRIKELKKLLSDSDYKIMKYLEGSLSEKEFIEIKQLRNSWRNEINQLEK